MKFQTYVFNIQVILITKKFLGENNEFEWIYVQPNRKNVLKIQEF